MTTVVKFCGLTRAEDVREAARLGAAYVGVIFAPSPRRIAPDLAGRILDDAGAARRVGVFPTAEPEIVATVAQAAALDVVQLHGDPTVEQVEGLRRVHRGAVWAVARVRDGRLPEQIGALADVADGVVLDAWAPAQLGGTGERFAWELVARQLDAWRRPGGAALVLAGGLRADNVGEAIALFAPDVVDVSSGVERAPGIKDHDRMREFADAVGAARAADAERR